MNEQSSLGQIWMAVFMIDLLRYIIPATAIFTLIWMARNILRKYRIQDTPWSTKQYIREIAFSLSTVVIFASIGTLLFLAIKVGLAPTFTMGGICFCPPRSSRAGVVLHHYGVHNSI